MSEDQRTLRSPLVRVSDIATATDIASRCNVTAQCVWQWYARHEDFPRPFLHRTRLTLWRWSEVRSWWEGRREVVGEH